jgi:hypothetical protein
MKFFFFTDENQEAFALRTVSFAREGIRRV